MIRLYGRAIPATDRSRRGVMGRLRVMILCGQSPRHLYVANGCAAPPKWWRSSTNPAASAPSKRSCRNCGPTGCGTKAWRWIRDRRRYTGGGEGKFFFGTATPALERPELARFVPHINHPDLLRLIDETSPDLIAVFGTSLLRGEILTKGGWAS